MLYIFGSFVVLRIEHRASRMLGKSSPIELCFQSNKSNLDNKVIKYSGSKIGGAVIGILFRVLFNVIQAIEK
jgi:hypothetical protein